MSNFLREIKKNRLALRSGSRKNLINEKSEFYLKEMFIVTY